jgi:hypothetical protein
VRSASRPCRFIPVGRSPGTDCVGGWVGPRAGLDDMEKYKFLSPQGLELRHLGRPARSQSLYRLLYPDSFRGEVTEKNLFLSDRMQQGNYWNSDCVKLIPVMFRHVLYELNVLFLYKHMLYTQECIRVHHIHG